MTDIQNYVYKSLPLNLKILITLHTDSDSGCEQGTKGGAEVYKTLARGCVRTGIYTGFFRGTVTVPKG